MSMASEIHSELSDSVLGRCDKHPNEIIQRVRWLEVSLLKIRFELEEWGLVDPVERVSQILWQR